MHGNAEAPPEPISAAPTKTVTRRVIGGITLYPKQLAKLKAFASARGLSRAAAIRQLIDEHL